MQFSDVTAMLTLYRCQKFYCNYILFNLQEKALQPKHQVCTTETTHSILQELLN